MFKMTYWLEKSSEQFYVSSSLLTTDMAQALSWQFSLTRFFRHFHDFYANSLISAWQPSSSLTFPGFPDKWPPLCTTPALTTHVDTVVRKPAACAFTDWRRVFKYRPRRHQRVDVDFAAVTGQHVRDEPRRQPTRLLQHHRSTCMQHAYVITVQIFGNWI